MPASTPMMAKALAMEQKNRKKSLTYYMRILHRDIGFLLIGLTLVFSLSGILLVYRQTDLLKSDTVVTRTVAGELSANDLVKALHLRKVKIDGDDGRYLQFSSDPAVRDGQYDRQSGAVTFVEKRLPSWLDKLNQLHKTSSSNTIHWFSVLYGVLLTFLAVSSFWMFKPSTRQFRRGMVFSAVGVAAAAALVSVV